MAAWSWRGEISGRRRATTQSHQVPALLKFIPLIMAGTQISTRRSTSIPWKPEAATPITVSGCSSTRILVPRTEGSAPYRLRQRS